MKTFASLQQLKQRFASNLSILARRLGRRPQQYPVFPPFLSYDQLGAFFLLVLFAFWVVDPLTVPAMRSLPAETKDLFAWITMAGQSDWYIALGLCLPIVLVFINWTRISRDGAVMLQLMGFWSLALFFSTAVGGLLVNLIKRMIGRARPKHFDDLGASYFDPFAFKSSFASFPSGHATTIGSVLFILLVFFPKWRLCWIALALLIISSRVIIGAHYPSDVLLGLLCGVLFSWFILSYFARRRLGFRVDKTAITFISPIMPRKPFSFSKVIDGLSLGLQIEKDAKGISSASLKKPGRTS